MTRGVQQKYIRLTPQLGVRPTLFARLGGLLRKYYTATLTK